MEEDRKPKVVGLVVASGGTISVVNITDAMLEAGADDMADWTNQYVSRFAVDEALSTMAREALRSVETCQALELA